MIFAFLAKPLVKMVAVKAIKFTAKVVTKAVQDEDKNVVDVMKEEVTQALNKMPNIVTDDAVDCEKQRRNAEKE